MVGLIMPKNTLKMKKWGVKTPFLLAMVGSKAALLNYR
jgi:hypothetical protein